MFHINNYMHTGKNNQEHDRLEHWLGKHNRKLELVRTLLSVFSAAVSFVLLLKLLNVVHL